jgi:hypothetical protein
MPLQQWGGVGEWSVILLYSDVIWHVEKFLFVTPEEVLWSSVG